MAIPGFERPLPAVSADVQAPLGPPLSGGLAFDRALLRGRQQLFDTVPARKLAQLRLAPQREHGVVPLARRREHRRLERVAADVVGGARWVPCEEAGQPWMKQARERDEG